MGKIAVEPERINHKGVEKSVGKGDESEIKSGKLKEQH